MKKVSFNLSLNIIKVYEIEKINYYDDYYDSISKYLNYETKDKNLDNQDDYIKLKNGKKIKRD